MHGSGSSPPSRHHRSTSSKIGVADDEEGGTDGTDDMTGDAATPGAPGPRAAPVAHLVGTRGSPGPGSAASSVPGARRQIVGRTATTSMAATEIIMPTTAAGRLTERRRPAPPMTRATTAMPSAR